MQPLLFPTLAEEMQDGTRTEASLVETIRAFISYCRVLGALPITDAERAMEQLLVLTTTQTRTTPSGDPEREWEFRVYGAESMRAYGSVVFVVEGSEYACEAPLEMLGLCLRIALNGHDSASPDDLRAMAELGQLLTQHVRSV